MPNAIYPKYKEKAGLNTLAIAAAGTDVRIMLIDTNGGTPYAYSGTHEFLSSVPAGARMGTSTALTSKTFTNGTFAAANTTVTGLANGATAEAFIIYNHTGTDATASLIAYFDTSQAGIPITGNGQEVNVTLGNLFTL